MTNQVGQSFENSNSVASDVRSPNYAQPSDQTLIEVQNINKFYGETQVLNDVSISLQPGVTGLLGPNGAGKSTLIKVILGLVRTTSGSGNVMGYDLLSSGKEIRNLIGYMPEDDSYIAGMQGIELVRYAACLCGMTNVEGLRRSHEILDYCDVGQERYRNVETYSTGMRQKTKVAQAIVADPPVLIFDEPTSGLDPEAREAMLNRIKYLSVKHGKTVIISTHILKDVQQICDHVIIMANGKVKLADRLENVHRPASPNLHLKILGDVNSFRDALERNGVNTLLDEDGNLRVVTQDGVLPKAVWTTAMRTKVSIQSVIPARNSLEAIFREVVGDDARAG